MFRYLVPPKEPHSLAMLARLSLVDLPFANSIKRCSPPASLNANNMKQTNLANVFVKSLFIDFPIFFWKKGALN